ncbi:MAG: calcium/sodium antiporter [Clostridia bacterium]|nr:calcium/sodium antiporter [Clostridia bacterium]
MWDIIGQILLLILGFVLLTKGADWFVDGASGIATKLKIPQIVIGLTIVAMGTSAPETAVSISSALKGSADITIGNVVGSNLINILIILGICSVITSLAVSKETVIVDIPVTIGATVLVFLLGLDGKITLIDGIIITTCFIAYLVYLFVATKKNLRSDSENELENSDESEKKNSLIKAIIFAILGLAAIIIGSDFTIDSATFLARKMNISERVIGLTVIALGTSLPELFTSVTAAIKKNADIAIGNIVGSCIFNLLLVVGISSIVTTVPFDAKFRIDALIALGATILLFVPCLINKKIGRITGILMLLSYAGYFTYLLLV